MTELIPTIFLWRQNDHFASPEDGKQFEKMLPHVPFHWIPNAGHQAQSDQSELVAGIVTEFLQEGRGQPARQSFLRCDG